MHRRRSQITQRIRKPRPVILQQTPERLGDWERRTFLLELGSSSGLKSPVSTQALNSYTVNIVTSSKTMQSACRMGPGKFLPPFPLSAPISLLWRTALSPCFTGSICWSQPELGKKLTCFPWINADPREGAEMG